MEMIKLESSVYYLLGLSKVQIDKLKEVDGALRVIVQEDNNEVYLVPKIDTNLLQLQWDIEDVLQEKGQIVKTKTKPNANKFINRRKTSSSSHYTNPRGTSNRTMGNR